MLPSILSSISGQFGKPLILGTLLPVTVFVILCLIFVVPLVPNDWQLLEKLMALDPPTIVAITFLTIILTGLLYSWNTVIIRFYQGYIWEYTWFGQWRIKHYQAELRATKEFMATTQVLRNELIRRNNRKYLSEIGTKRIKAGLKINNHFPNASSLVLPTRLGNVIRSSDTYPTVQYNMSGVTLLSRLRSKIDKDYLSAIEDAKMPLDFLINCSFLSAVLALLTLLCGLLYPIPLTTRGVMIWWALKILIFIIVSWASYVLSIGQAEDWGRMFRGAFDLYRWDLLKQFGYKQVPTNMAEERAIWGTISRQVIYGDPPGSRLVEQYTNATTFTYGYLYDEPFMTDLPTARGVSLPDARGVVTVTLRVKNADGQKRAIGKITIRDTLPDGFEYLWGTALCDGMDVTVFGANPYYFETKDLPYDGELVVTYRIALRKK